MTLLDLIEDTPTTQCHCKTRITDGWLIFEELHTTCPTHYPTRKQATP